MLAFGHFLWQSTMIAVLLMFVMRAASTSAARYSITLSALLLMTVCPVITFVWLSQPTHSAADVRPDPARKNKVTAPPSTAEVPIVGPAFGVFNTPLESPITLPPSFPLMEVVAPVEQSAWERIAPLLTSSYLSGVVLMLFRLAIGLWGGRTLRGQSTPVTEASILSALRRQVDALGLKLQPALAYCEHVTVPTVMGIFRPMILLPLSLTSGLTSDQLESILAHELAHLRRYDHLVNLLQRVIESLLFFHPAVWWVSNRVREEREHCCDDLVIACGALPFDYAASLLRVAELSRPSTLRPAVAAVSLLATGNKPSNLRQRIARLLGESADSHLRFRRQWPVIFLCTVCVILAGAALKVGAQSAEVDPQPAIANLPGNITVELVGVTFHTSSNKPEPDWWTPSGGPLAKVPKPRKSFLGATAPEKHRIFAVKVGGTPESTAVNVRVSRADDRVDFSTWGGGYAGKESDPPLFWTAGPFIHGKETTVRVMLLVDDWGPVQQVSTEAKRIDEPKLLPIYQRCYANIAPQKAEERSRQTALTFHWPTDQDYLATFEIWAVDKQGTRLRSGGTAGAINAREFMFDGPLAEIDHFEYRLRPFRHWVTFENVSVQPGHHTPVKVKVESLPGETNEAQEHAAAEEAFEVEAASDEPVVAYPGIEFRIAAGEADRKTDGVAWLPIVEPRMPVMDGKSGANMPVEEKRDDQWRGLVWETTADAMLADGTWQIKQCYVVPSQFETGLRKEFHIQIELDAAGSQQMLLLTSTHLQQAMAIVVDGTIISAPIIQDTISNKMLITGNYNEEAATKLADTIRKGRAKPEAETVVGTVISLEGQPKAGIEVLPFEGAPKPPRELNETFRTDANGQFRVPKVWHETDRRLTLVARRGKEQLGWFDFALHQPSETSPEPEDGSFHVMLLPMSRTVQGRILDEEGMPLAKASVQIASLEHAVNSRADSWIHKRPGTVPLLEGAVTGEDGTFVLRLPRDTSASLKVSHPDRVTEWINVSKDEVNFADVKLSKATIVVGRVTDSRTGMPIAGIDIGLRMGDRPTSKFVQLPAGRANVNKAPVEVAVFVGGIATTDANGDYKVSGLRSGEYTIEFIKGADPTLAAPCMTNVVLESGDTFHADFELPVGKHLTGRVVDGETGEPIFGCTVTYSGDSRNGTTGLETKTNVKGEFKLLVPPGRCRVDAMADHFSVEGSVRNLYVLDEGEPESVVLKAGPSNKPVPEGF